MREDWYQKEIDYLIKIVAGTKSEDKITELFDKILTPREINDIARRLQAIEMLEAGKSYSEIREKLKLSPVIISRLSNKIGYGFRRTNCTSKKVIDKPQRQKKTISYKGVKVRIPN